MLRSVTPGTSSRLRTVDHGETYGRHILAAIAPTLSISTCVDLGCGAGADLGIVQASHPQAQCYGVDFGDWNAAALRQKNITPLAVNIEAEPLPLADESMDLVIANQVLEHTKEVFWINHEIFRVLRVGGISIWGCPMCCRCTIGCWGWRGCIPPRASCCRPMCAPFLRTIPCCFIEKWQDLARPWPGSMERSSIPFRDRWLDRWPGCFRRRRFQFSFSSKKRPPTRVNLSIIYRKLP